MAKKIEAVRLANIRKATPKVPVIGVFATSDPRITKEDRQRCQNIAKMAADCISGRVVLPDRTPVPVVYSTVLVDGEPPADLPSVSVNPDWPRANYHMMKALVHAMRSLDAFSAEAELQRKWWESSIESEYEAMLAAGEAKAKEEGHSAGE